MRDGTHFPHGLFMTDYLTSLSLAERNKPIQDPLIMSYHRGLSRLPIAIQHLLPRPMPEK